MELTDLIQEECARFVVPGAAVAAVVDDHVVLSEGFGRRNERDPVTRHTRYMLASDTKCFAAASLCLLAEDGLLDLDEPIRTYLPWFAMHDDSVSGLVTSVDLLAHRTGLPRHSLMTIGDGDFAITNEDIARRMRFLQPSRPFRESFGYSNVHYATAGHVAEVVSGKPWRELLRQRILDPLGMAETTTYSPAQTAGDFAAPHARGSWLPFQSRPYDLPSGGIVTNAADLNRWLLARLGRASLSDQVLKLLHAPVVSSGEALPFPELESRGYALGNLAFDYRGHPLHLHGGNQVGFSSQVIVLPDAQIGVAVLTNDHGSTLPLALGLTIVDHLLGLTALPWGERLAVPRAPSGAPARAGAPPVRDLHEYTGTFHDPGYGTLQLAVRESALTVAFHGLGDALRLTHLAEDTWLLGLHDLPEMTVPVSFGTVAGNIADVRVQVDPELPPLVFQRQ